jgi:hypothetical protein
MEQVTTTTPPAAPRRFVARTKGVFMTITP